eukprot:360870-Chlamydomonas_euryale.AAC.20
MLQLLPSPERLTSFTDADMIVKQWHLVLQLLRSFEYRAWCACAGTCFLVLAYVGGGEQRGRCACTSVAPASGCCCLALAQRRPVLQCPLRAGLLLKQCLNLRIS